MDKKSLRRERYERLLRVSVAHGEPDIIIWGPGRHNTQDYQKRERVRKAIQDEVRYGSVVFPEDPEVQDISSKILGSENVDLNELLQAAAADIIIVLDISAAAGEELARYSTYPKVASKLFVVAPEEHKSGYQEAIRNEVCVRFVKTEEMVSCNKTTKLCIDHVRVWCVQNYLSTN